VRGCPRHHNTILGSAGYVKLRRRLPFLFPCFDRRLQMNSCTILKLALAGTLASPAVLAQECNSHIRHSAPDDRYVVNAAKGTVLDKQTGLMWKRCIEGLSGANCGGSVTYLDWGGALSQAAASAFASYKDWRLPNRKELESLVEVACVFPAINATVFPHDPAVSRVSVWASSPYASQANLAWFVGFDDGWSDYDVRVSTRYAVRLVRGGQ